MLDFRPPAGRMEDFGLGREVIAQRWNNYLHASLRQVAEAPENRSGSFFVPHDGDRSRRLEVFWDAFPSEFRRWFGTDERGRERANAAAETPLENLVGYRRTEAGMKPVGVRVRQQPEYCEWFTEREQGRLTRVTFTCESPEYWRFLAEQDPDLSLIARLYSERLGRTVFP